jgi:AcrR family transcriptional regulator
LRRQGTAQGCPALRAPPLHARVESVSQGYERTAVHHIMHGLHCRRMEREALLTRDKPNTPKGAIKSKTDEFFAEIGNYFAVDGTLHEKEFRQSLKKSLDFIKTHAPDEATFSGHANQWLSRKLGDIIDYLNEKGMPEASFSLFKTAIEECASLGLQNIALPTENLAYIVTHAQDTKPKREKINASNKKRERVIDAALKIFDRDGFHRATMDDIAKLADVGKGSIYRYFVNKEDLLQCLLIERTEKFLEGMNVVFEIEMEVPERIQLIINSWVKFISENNELYSLIHNIIQINDTTSREIFFQQLIGKLPMLKERAVALTYDNRTRISDLTFETIFIGSLGFVDWVYYKWIRAGKSYNLMDEIPMIIDMLLHGCLIEPAP